MRLLEKTVCRLFSTLIALSLSIAAQSKSDGAQFPDVTARGAVVLDRSTGDVIGGKNANQRLAMASTTKIMTVLLALEAIDEELVTLDEEVAISCFAAATWGRRMQGSDDDTTLEIGDTIRFEDLIYGALLNSGNNATVAIAEKVATVNGVGGRPHQKFLWFVNRMNQRAGQLGLVNTKFVNSHGRDPEKTLEELDPLFQGACELLPTNYFAIIDENNLAPFFRTLDCDDITFEQSVHEDPDCAHFTTARDLAMLADHALDHSRFREISSTQWYETKGWKDRFGTIKNTTYDPEGNPIGSIQRSKNWLIQHHPSPGNSSGSRYRGAFGVKTGSTENAGVCLVSAAQRCGVELVAIVLGSEIVEDENGKVIKTFRYDDSIAMLDWGFEQTIEVPDSLSLPFLESFETDGVGCRYTIKGVADLPVDLRNRRYIGLAEPAEIPYPQYSGEAFKKVFAVKNYQGVPDGLPQGDPDGRLTFVPFDLGAATGVTVRMRVAASSESSFDEGDRLFIQYRLDGSTWRTLAAFRSEGFGESRLREDTNLDGRGDGTILGTSFQEFSWDKFTGGNARLHLRIVAVGMDGAGDGVAVDLVRVSGQASLGGTGYGNWKESEFDGIELDDLQISGPEGDANGDGVSNLIAYFMGESPWDPVAALLPRMTTIPWAATEEAMFVTYRRRIDAWDVGHRIEVSSDGGTWRFNGDGSRLSFTEEVNRVRSEDGRTELITVRLKQGSLPRGRAFMRLRTELLTPLPM